MPRPRPVLLAAVLAAAALALPAEAAARDPHRWHFTARHTVPIQYFQGMAVGDGALFFDGIQSGLYRTTTGLHQTAGVDDGKLIPAAVTATQKYNHIGDLTYDPRGRGRVLLPLECYDGTNCAGTGAIGVADPRTLAWRYDVELDPRDIPKAMFCELSPDHKLLWTSSGNDLLAYRVADISPAHAFPATPIRPARRLRGAVPPSGVTGATFYAGRLFLAGSIASRFEVWSVDPRTGTRRLEIERTIVGESEGLATVDALGGALHWLIQPNIPEGPTPSTYPRSTLLSFLPRVTPHAALRPARLVAGRRTAVRIRVTARVLGRARPLAGATVRLLGRHARTNARGRARLTVRAPRGGTFTARLAWRGDRGHTRVKAESKK